jgi:putative ABC transport system permease protein
MLSLLGVTIGIFSIIFVLSVVDSMEAEMKASFDMIGSDVMFIQKWPMSPEDGAAQYEWWKYIQRRAPAYRDMVRLEKRLENASALAFANGSSCNVFYGNNSFEDANLSGVTFQYRETVAVRIGSGRYFTREECEAGNNICMIGLPLSLQLFGSDNPIGREIKIDGLTATVIAVFEKEGTSLFGDGFDYTVMVPYTFSTRLIPSDNEDTQIVVKASPGVTNEDMRGEVIQIFREVRGIKPREEKDFSIIEAAMINEMVDGIIAVFNIVGIVIGIFAILVGAFSIANIMFVSVSERTPIIGIQKALGAKNYFILVQFLAESIMLCLIGGAIGLFVVWLVSMILSLLIDFQFILPMARIILGIAISVVVGVVAGIIPAMKAALMNPVDAIRSS